jgi:hypothetical protein
MKRIIAILLSCATASLPLAEASAGGLQNVARNALGNAVRGTFANETRVVTFGSSSAVFNKRQITNFAGSQGNLSSLADIQNSGNNNIVVLSSGSNNTAWESPSGANLQQQTFTNGVPNQAASVNVVQQFTNFQSSGQETASLYQSEFEQYRSTATIQSLDLVNELFNEAATLSSSLF